MAKGARKSPRNTVLPGGVPKLSRSAVYRKKAIYKKKKTVVAKKPEAVAAFKTVTVGGEKNGKTRTVAVQKASRYYPTEDVPSPFPSRKVFTLLFRVCAAIVSRSLCSGAP